MAYEDVIPDWMNTPQMVELVLTLFNDQVVRWGDLKPVLVALFYQNGMDFDYDFHQLMQRRITLNEYVQKHPERPFSRKWLSPPALEIPPGGSAPLPMVVERAGLPARIRDLFLAQVPAVPVSRSNLREWFQAIQSVPVDDVYKVQVAITGLKAVGNPYWDDALRLFWGAIDVDEYNRRHVDDWQWR